MKLLTCPHCIAVTYKNKTLFAHGEALPFITLVTENGENVQLQNAQILCAEEDKIALRFYQENHAVTVCVTEEKNAVKATFEGEDSAAYIYLHAEKEERLSGGGYTPLFDLKGSLLISAPKTDVKVGFLRKILYPKTHRVSPLIPRFISGNGYGICIDAEVQEMDFRSPLASKISVKTLPKSILFAVDENAETLRNSLYALNDTSEKEDFSPLAFSTLSVVIASLINASSCDLPLRFSNEGAAKQPLEKMWISAFLPNGEFNEKEYSEHPKAANKLARTRVALAPYLTCARALRTYEEDPSAGFYVGADLLAVFKKDMENPVTTIAFPKGEWRSLWEEKTFTGEEPHTVVNREDMPFVFYRSGSVLEELKKNIE